MKHIQTISLGSTIFAALLSLLSCTALQAANLDEATAGDFSNSGLNPTPWFLAYGQGGNNGPLGNNILSGSVGAPGVGLDRDYVHFVVPQGYALTQLLVGNQTTFGGNGSFIGLAAGTSISINPNTTTTAAGLMGYQIYGASTLGTDILDDMSAPLNGSSGFSRPLGFGDYTLWLQELSSVGPYNYRFNLLLAPIPEPRQFSLMLAGLAIVIGVVRRRHLARTLITVTTT